VNEFRNRSTHFTICDAAQRDITRVQALVHEKQEKERMKQEERKKKTLGAQQQVDYSGVGGGCCCCVCVFRCPLCAHETQDVVYVLFLYGCYVLLLYVCLGVLTM